MELEYKFKAKLWLYTGDGAWHFITLPKNCADEIKSLSGPIRKGFGSVKVNARIGSTEFTTSIFPDSKTGSYILPVKKAVREANRLREGDNADVTLSIINLE